MTTDIMLSLALMEMSGHSVEITAIDAMTCAIGARLRPINPAWLNAWKMAHSDHSTIRFDGAYFTPQIWL